MNEFIHFLFSLHRYKGKKRPDTLLAEICWWSKTIYQTQDVEDEEQQGECGWQQSDESDYDDDDDDDDSDQAGPSQPKIRRK